MSYAHWSFCFRNDLIIIITLAATHMVVMVSTLPEGTTDKIKYLIYTELIL